METDVDSEVNKIINIGCHKTGTTTFECMMEVLGYRVCNFDHTFFWMMKKNDIQNLLRIARKWDVVSDFPWYLCYKELDRAFPGSKFVITIRDVEDWYKSITGHFGSERKQTIQWIYGEENVMRNPAKIKSIYENHNKAVIEYFKDRPKDLLIVDWKIHGWEEICRFLDRPVPRFRINHKPVPLPIANTAAKREKNSNSVWNKYFNSHKINLRLRIFKRSPTRMIFLLYFPRRIRKKVLQIINKARYI